MLIHRRSSICVGRPPSQQVANVHRAHRRSSTCVSTKIAAPRPQYSIVWGTFTTSMVQRKKATNACISLFFVLIHRVNTQTHHVNTSKQHYYFIISILLLNETVLRHHRIYITHAHANLELHLCCNKNT